MTDSDFHPTANGEMMRWRAALLKRVREFFESRDFLEVETPLLSHDTVVDRFIEPYGVDEAADDRETLWLQTSPEFAMKRLLAAGEERIFQIAKAFRREEAGSLHNPEFTILEWYRTGDSYQQGRELLADFCRDVVDATQVDSITYRAAMQQFAGVDPFDASVADLVAAGGEQSPATTDRDEALNYLLAMKVEPNLGAGAPVILYDYPASQ
ncbi:MAG: EF-P lysine aminoacylase GenX, partial [bacterium]|nr:EF-P lysine aminoacylase GenX [bacterium]